MATRKYTQTKWKTLAFAEDIAKQRLYKACVKTSKDSPKLWAAWKLAYIARVTFEGKALKLRHAVALHDGTLDFLAAPQTLKAFYKSHTLTGDRA